MPENCYCSVFGCSNDSKKMPHLTYFGIPKHKDIRLKWMAAINRADLSSKNGTAFVCSTHFSKAMLMKKRLKYDAVPTLNLVGKRSYRGSLTDTRRRPIDLTPVDSPASIENSTQTDFDCPSEYIEREYTNTQSCQVSVATQTLWP